MAPNSREQKSKNKRKIRSIVVSATRSEQGKQIVHAKFIALDLVSTERCCSKRTFLLLQVEDTVLNCICDPQFVDVHCTLLTKTMGTVVSLVLSKASQSGIIPWGSQVYLECWVPPHINQDDIVTSGQIETLSWLRISEGTKHNR